MMPRLATFLTLTIVAAFSGHAGAALMQLRGGFRPGGVAVFRRLMREACELRDESGAIGYRRDAERLCHRRGAARNRDVFRYDTGGAKVPGKCRYNRDDQERRQTRHHSSNFPRG